MEPADTAMLEIFRAEADRHLLVLSQGLAAQHDDDAASPEPQLAELIRAARAVKGTARIVKCVPAARVAEHIETALANAGPSAGALTPAKREQLVKACKLLDRIAEATGPSASPEWSLLTQDVDALLAEASPTDPDQPGAPSPSDPGHDVTLTLDSDLTESNIERYLTQARHLLAHAPPTRPFVLDIRATRVIDTPGVNLLLGLRRECDKDGRTFEITGSTEPIEKLFTLYQLDFGPRAPNR